MTPESDLVMARRANARLRRYAWLVQQSINADDRARAGPADRAIAEQHKRRVRAATAVILGTAGGGIEDRAVDAATQLTRLRVWNAPEEGGAA